MTIKKPFTMGLLAVTVSKYMAGVKDSGCKPPEWLEEGSGCDIKTPSDDHYKNSRGADGRPLSHRRRFFARSGGVSGIAFGQDGQKLRLLSEAEFEYAARAGTTTPFWSGESRLDEPGKLQWQLRLCGKPKGRISRQDLCRWNPSSPNPWGLYQVHGNVREWCKDCSIYSYKGAPDDGSPWTARRFSSAFSSRRFLGQLRSFSVRPSAAGSSGGPGRLYRFPAGEDVKSSPLTWLRLKLRRCSFRKPQRSAEGGYFPTGLLFFASR